MTREKLAIKLAIDIMERNVSKYINHGIYEVSDTDGAVHVEFAEAINILNEMLEQQPCEDAISRENVKDAIKPYIQEIITESGVDKNEHTNRTIRAILNTIENMPSVQPKSPWIRIEFKGDALNCPLPDDGERVYLRFKNGYVTTDTCQVTIDEEDNTCYGFEDNPDFEDIDAWMRIPE